VAILVRNLSVRVESGLAPRGLRLKPRCTGNRGFFRNLVGRFARAVKQWQPPMSRKPRDVCHLPGVFSNGRGRPPEENPPKQSLDGPPRVKLEGDSSGCGLGQRPVRPAANNMNSTFQSLLVARVHAAIGAAQAVAGLAHPGLKGLLREIVVRELFRPLLPPRAGLGHGQIISSYDQQSTEQDIVIFDRELVPSLLLDETNGIFPIEAALYAIEVKSSLNFTQLREVHDKAKSLKSMLYVPGPPPEHVIPCLFAFSSDLGPESCSELERYKEVLNGAVPSIRSMCVVGRGYWFFGDGEWHSVASSPGREEVVFFLADILATYARVAGTRTRPSLRSYLS
jgi:hypothetical protein